MLIRKDAILTKSVGRRKWRTLWQCMFEGNGVVIRALPIRDIGASNLLSAQRPHANCDVNFLFSTLNPWQKRSSTFFCGHSHGYGNVDVRSFRSCHLLVFLLLSLDLSITQSGEPMCSSLDPINRQTYQSHKLHLQPHLHIHSSHLSNNEAAQHSTVTAKLTEMPILLKKFSFCHINQLSLRSYFDSTPWSLFQELGSKTKELTRSPHQQQYISSILNRKRKQSQNLKPPDWSS